MKKIYIDDYKDLVIITLPKSICVDLPVKIYKSLKDHFKFIVSYNEFLAEYKIKIEIFRLLNGTQYAYEHKKEFSYLLETLNYM